MPTVVFSHPPMATCGLTEPDARAQYGDSTIKVYQSKFTNLFFGHWQVRKTEAFFRVGFWGTGHIYGVFMVSYSMHMDGTPCLFQRYLSVLCVCCMMYRSQDLLLF